ncbi:hypothetical protein GOV09_03625 [Candidatus Woesearchaeota archaeon]|nr:hypothetical protein [Candidatus Woesearchaeota archaeon]
MNKRADFGIGWILLIIVIILALGWLVNEGWKECRVDSDCSEAQYCGSDFSCHDMQIFREVGSPQGIHLNSAVVFLGISIIIAAVIMKWDTLFKKKKKKKPEHMGHNIEEKGLYQDDLDEEEEPQSHH